MVSMFRGIGVSNIDLSNFDMRKISSVGREDGFLFRTNSLWKLTIGPNVRFYPDTQLSSVRLINPIEKIVVNDVNDSRKYFCTSPKWAEVDFANGGTPHNPKGALKDQLDIKNETLTRNDVRTYVWDQS